MAVPNYTYLKLKMSSPYGVVTVSTTSQHVYQCDIECIEQDEAIIKTEFLITNLKSFAQDAPNPKHHAESFESMEETKLIFLDPKASEGKALRISSSLDPK